MSEPGLPRRVAMLLSCNSFEKFFGGNFGLDRDAYIENYRNDFAWSYGEALLERGHDVFIYVLSYGPGELRTAPNGIKIRFLPLPRRQRVLDALLFRLSRLPGGALLRDTAALGSVWKPMRDAFARDRIDLLYVQEVWTARSACLLQTVTLPVIAADHGAPYLPGFDWWRRRVFPRAVCMTCQTTENLERVSALGGNAVLIPNGVDDTFFTPGAARTEPRPRTVLSVGRLTEPQKRFSDLIRTLELLPEFSLTLVGAGPDEALLKRLAEEAGVADRVSFPGFVQDRAALRELYRNCGVFVSSSAWEAMALVVLEAMSCGAPVVLTRIPSFEALLADGSAGQLVEIGNVAGLAQAIRAVHAGAEVYGPCARERVLEAYSARHSFDRLSDIMRLAPLH